MKCIYVIFFTLRQLSINTKYILAGLDNYNQLRMQWFPYDHTADVSPHPVPASRSLANRYRRITTFLTLKTQQTKILLLIPTMFTTAQKRCSLPTTFRAVRLVHLWTLVEVRKYFRFIKLSF